MYETNKAVISSASSHTDAWHWQVLCMHWDCHRGIPTWSKHWENMKSVQWHKRRRAQNSFFPIVNSSTSPLIYASASYFHRLDRFLHFRKYAKAVGGNNYTSYSPNLIVILNMRLAEWIGMNSMSHAVVIFTGIYSHFMDLILKTSRYGSIVPFFWGVSKARIRTCFPQMQSAEGTACFWQWRSKPGDQCFRSQVVDVQSDSTQAGEERCPEAEMPYIILHLALKKTYKTVTKCLPSDFSLQRLAVQLELFSSKLPPPMKECKQIQILCCKENSGALRPQTGETNIECCKRHVAIMLQMIKGHPH